MARFAGYQLLPFLLIVFSAGPFVRADTPQAANSAATDATAAQAKEAQIAKKLKIAPTETTIYLEDLHCSTCAKKIARKLFTVKGVVKIRSDVAADVVVVTPQTKKKLEAEALWNAAVSAGFPVVKLTGPTGIYLPHPETKAAQKVEQATPQTADEAPPAA